MTFEVLLLLGLCFVGTGYGIVSTVSPTSYCNSFSSCGLNRVCCNHQCVYDSDCLGRSCDPYSSSDVCNGMQCCYDSSICQYDCDYYSPVPAIIGIVVGVCAFIGIVSLIIYCVCRRRRSMANPRGGYIVAQPQVYTYANYNQIPTQQPYYQQVYGQPPPQQGYGAI